MNSQCERTGEFLVQAQRDDARLLTFLKPDVDADVELELLDDCHSEERKRRGGARVEFSFVSGAEDDLDGPADIYVPTHGCRSLKLSRSYP